MRMHSEIQLHGKMRMHGKIQMHGKMQMQRKDITDRMVRRSGKWIRARLILPASLSVCVLCAGGNSGAAESIISAAASDLSGTYSLPESYSLADDGKQPAVKSQGSYGTCWALAATSAMESVLLPDNTTVLSADHMALKNDFEVPIDDGGDYYMTMAYLSGWQGPAAEADDPYGDQFSPDGLAPVVHVQEMRLLDGASREELKQTILQYGAVQTSLYMNKSTVSPDAETYLEQFSAYYDAEERIQNHDIIIIGWNDRFSRFMFRETPETDGAWICQNSWGEDFGEGGIFYVSYEDANIARNTIAYTRIEDTDNYDVIYQTDTCGWQGTQGYGDDICWFANQYRADRDRSLEAAGFYAVGTDTSYEIYLEMTSGQNTGQRTLLASGELEYAGYYTVDFETPVSLKENETFVLMAKVHTPGSESPAAVEYAADDYTRNVVTEGKYGYLSHDGEHWTHTEEAYGTNVCLKAYLSDAEF